jgi:hypothetical protein
MGVNGPLHWGGSLRWVAQALRVVSASTKVHRVSRPQRPWRRQRMLRSGMGNDSEVAVRIVRDTGRCKLTPQLRLIRSGLILRHAAFTARPL